MFYINFQLIFLYKSFKQFQGPAIILQYKIIRINTVDYYSLMFFAYLVCKDFPSFSILILYPHLLKKVLINCHPVPSVCHVLFLILLLHFTNQTNHLLEYNFVVLCSFVIWFKIFHFDYIAKQPPSKTLPFHSVSMSKSSLGT